MQSELEGSDVLGEVLRGGRWGGRAEAVHLRAWRRSISS